MDFVNNYVEQNGNMTVDEGDERGRTPLMRACLCGNMDVVEYLLQRGAGVNTECTQLRNTPLHYTCKWVDNGFPYIGHPTGTGRMVPKTLAEKVAIAKVLLGYGAVYKANTLGLTPICYAGLHQMKPLVDLLGDEMESKEAVDASLKTEKIKGLESLGVAYVLDSYSLNFATSRSCMLEAKRLSFAYSYPVPRSDRSCEIEKLFKRKECSTIEELESLGQDKDAIQVEVFLLGARIIPDELKAQYYWDALFDFGRSRKDFAQTCSIFSFLVRIWNTTHLALYNIFDTLLDSIMLNDLGTQSILDLNGVMMLCVDYHSSSFTDEDLIPNVVVEILTNAALCTRGEHFESLTTTVIRILMLFKKDEPCTKLERSTFFPAWTMIDMLPDKISERFGYLAEGANDHHIKHAFSRLLYLNDASQTSFEEEDTLLHNTMNILEIHTLAHSDEVFAMVMYIIRMIIRHGCPVDARNEDGFTAKDVALDFIKDRNPNYEAGGEYDTDDSDSAMYTGYESNNPRIIKLLAALSGPSSVLTLEELAARVVLKWKIPYRDYLPKKLHNIVS